MLEHMSNVISKSKIRLWSEQEERIERILVKNFSKKLIKNYEEICKTVVSNGKIMIIQKMQWRYDFFNVAFLNNVLSLVLYSLYKGYLPVIAINDESDEFTKWDWYFEQPWKIIMENVRGGVQKVI